MSDSSEPDNDDRPDAGALGDERPGYGDPTRQPGYPGPAGGGPSPESGGSYGQQEPYGQDPGPYGPPPGDPHGGGQGYPQDYPQGGQGYPQGGGQSYPNNYPQGNQNDYQQGYQQPGGYPGAYVPVPDHPQATTALTLGLVGMIGTMICGIPAVVGPFAWYVGARAKREIDASGGQLGGRGQALTGFVLGIITTVLLIIGILVLGGLLAVGLTGGFDAAG